ncbi:MAG: hypothetical protein DMD81_18050 [Candidatus Rokuibacteriota bacterium]|nr:MAG: hypothetical protein DMD81_18050 [Candidatus Rokubacteria bacterium]
MIVGQLGGESRAALGDAWAGAERRADAPEGRADAPGVFDWYGVADAGVVAAEGPDHAGLYLWEDAHHVEILDVDSGAPVVDGRPGNVCVTVLFKDDVFPMVRYNTNDVSAIDPSPSPLGLPLRRLTGVVGRSDNMIKLRGINVYPTAIGEMLQGPPGVTGEYLCRVARSMNSPSVGIWENRATVYAAGFATRMRVVAGMRCRAAGAEMICVGNSTGARSYHWRYFSGAGGRSANGFILWCCRTTM